MGNFPRDGENSPAVARGDASLEPCFSDKERPDDLVADLKEGQPAARGPRITDCDQCVIGEDENLPANSALSFRLSVMRQAGPSTVRKPLPGSPGVRPAPPTRSWRRSIDIAAHCRTSTCRPASATPAVVYTRTISDRTDAELVLRSTGGRASRGIRQ